jgi:hypothetical protein
MHLWAPSLQIQHPWFSDLARFGPVAAAAAAFAWYTRFAIYGRIAY